MKIRPCSICLEVGTECTFMDPPSKRQRRGTFPVSAPDQGPIPGSYHETDGQDGLAWPLDDASPTSLPILPNCATFLPNGFDLGLPSHLQHDALLPSHHGFWRFSSATDDLFPLNMSLEQLQPEPALNHLTDVGVANALVDSTPQPIFDAQRDENVLSNSSSRHGTSQAENPRSTAAAPETVSPNQPMLLITLRVVRSNTAVYPARWIRMYCDISASTTRESVNSARLSIVVSRQKHQRAKPRKTSRFQCSF